MSLWPHADANTYSDGDSNCYAECYSHTDADTYGDANSNDSSKSDADSHTYCNHYCYSYAKSNTNSETQSNTEVSPHSAASAVAFIDETDSPYQFTGGLPSRRLFSRCSL
jgi:hypothetical protein